MKGTTGSAMNVISCNDGSRRAAEKQLNDSGFTLIELVVGITVMLFVMLSVTVFVSVGTRGYTTSSSEVSLQMESQIALNQIEDIVMEGAELSPAVELSGCTVQPVIMSDGRILLILDRANKRLLEYSQSAEQITGRDGKVLPVSADDVSAAVRDYREYMLAQGVTSLTLQQDDPKSSLVKVTIGFERPGKSRSVTGAYRMRNFVAPEK